MQEMGKSELVQIRTLLLIETDQETFISAEVLINEFKPVPDVDIPSNSF